MTLATKERIIARRQVSSDRFIRATKPVFWVDLSKNDGTQFTSDDAYGHLATVVGALWTPEGRTLDGTDDKITVADHTALDVTGDLTIIAVVKRGLIGSQQIILARTGMAPDPGGISLYFSDINNIRFDFPYIGNVIDSASAITSITSFYHIALTRSGTTFAIYFNGRLVKTNVDATANQATASALYLGVAAEGVQFLKGTIGEAMIYNRALSALEIQNNYLATRWRYT